MSVTGSAVRVPVDAITVVVAGFALGITGAWHAPAVGFWPWTAVAAFAAILGLVARRRRAVQVVAIALAVAGAGGGWLTLRTQHAARDDVAAALGAEAVPVRLRGVAQRAPRVVDPPAGPMSRFDFRGPLTCFPMRVEKALPRDGAPAPRGGRVLVCVDETLVPFAAGATVEVTGMLRRPRPPANPGAPDRRRLVGAGRRAGVVHVPSRELVVVTPRPPGATHRRVRAWRDTVRRRARTWLLADLPGPARSRRDTLLVALLLGERGGDAAEHEAFRRVGVAHLLAISGLHLGVVVSLAMLAFGRRAPPRWRGAIVVLLVVAYLALVEVRLPVLRAAAMATAVGLGLAGGRRLRTASLVSLSAMVLLVVHPEELFQPGFQLSFGVVLGLVHLAPRVRERWFGPANHGAATSAQMLGQWAATALAAAAVAWAIALPIVAHHFGMISPWGVPISVLTVPLVALVLALGYAKIVLALVLPSAALLVGAVLAVAADLLLSLVEAVDALPGSVVYVPRPGAAWTLAALAWAGAWAAGLAPRARRAWAVLGAALAAWLAWPALAPAPPLRLDMLAVGDGTCHVVRSGGRVLVFDAGSISDPRVAQRTLVPALRALGVRTIDSLAISHANLDHFSAVIELSDAFDVREVLVTAPFEAAAAAAPDGAAADALAGLGRRRVGVTRIAAGRTWRLGRARVRCLHPVAGASYDDDNDASLVLLIETAGRRVLLTGDLEAGGVRDLRRRNPGLRADVVELPHHGAYDEAAAAFVRGLEPAVALQSTGVRRWRRDGWRRALEGVERLVTARDGACRVEIDGAGRVRVGRFVEHGRSQVGGQDVAAAREATSGVGRTGARRRRTTGATVPPPPPRRSSPAAARPRAATRRCAGR